MACLNPILLERKNERLIERHKLAGLSFGACTSLYSDLRKWKNVGYEPTKYRLIQVPCGKCINCLKARQAEIATRAAREAEKRGSMHFLTLTYEDKYLPLAQTIRRWNTDTGEFVDITPVEPLVDGTSYKKDMSFKKLSKIYGERAVLVTQARAKILSLKPGRQPRYWCFPLDVPEPFAQGYYYECVITPSLSRKDFKLWLKGCRVAYEREFGNPLPDFSYLACGEYGPNTCRPHYHVAFFGLTTKQVQFMEDRWKYGFTNLKTVKAINEDGTSGFTIASRYIAKYVSKGKFECYSVKCRHAIKLRLLTSEKFGADLDDNLISYYRGYDLYGKYDIDSGVLSNGRILSSEQVRALSNVLSKRLTMTVNGQSMRLPQCLIKKIWYVKEHDGYFRASAVRNALSALTRVDNTRVRLDAFIENHPNNKDRPLSDLVNEFYFFEESRVSLQEAFNEVSLQSFYNKSIC